MFGRHVIIGEPAASSHHFKREGALSLRIARRWGDRKRESYDRFWRKAAPRKQPLVPSAPNTGERIIPTLFAFALNGQFFQRQLWATDRQ